MALLTVNAGYGLDLVCLSRSVLMCHSQLEKDYPCARAVSWFLDTTMSPFLCTSKKRYIDSSCLRENE